MIPPEVFAETLFQFFAPVRRFLDDPAVSDIVINGPFEVFVERHGRLERTDARFETRAALIAALRNAAQFVGKPIDESRPIFEGRLPDGSRIEAIMPPASPDGPHVAIRRFSTETLTVERLIGFGALTEDAAAALAALVIAKFNIVVAGGTGSGKTSMLNALSSYIPRSDRVVVIEDSRELTLQRPHVVSLEARPPAPDGRGEVTIRELFRATLRLRPDRIVVGEIRGGEALDLVQAMTSGHGGCLSTLHATYPRDTLTRIETMAMMSDVAIPLPALRAQIASAVNIVVQTARMPEGGRAITHIAEVGEYDAARGYPLRELFVRRPIHAKMRGGADSELVAVGLPRALAQLRAHGVDLPSSMYDASSRAADE